MAHFRLISDVNYLPYGRSYIEPARKLYKQYVLMEDAMLIHRISRAPEKRIFYMNVGSIPPNEIDAFMQKTISNLKRTPFQDNKTGEYNLKFNNKICWKIFISLFVEMIKQLKLKLHLDYNMMVFQM